MRAVGEREAAGRFYRKASMKPSSSGVCSPSAVPRGIPGGRRISTISTSLSPEDSLNALCSLLSSNTMISPSTWCRTWTRETPRAQRAVGKQEGRDTDEVSQPAKIIALRALEKLRVKYRLGGRLQNHTIPNLRLTGSELTRHTLGRMEISCMYFLLHNDRRSTHHRRCEDFRTKRDCTNLKSGETRNDSE